MALAEHGHAIDPLAPFNPGRSGRRFFRRLFTECLLARSPVGYWLLWIRIPTSGREQVIRIRKAHDRGHAALGWLDTYHTFSFSTYQDPEHMGFRSLRVMNEDYVAPGQGFGTHPHRDMEIVTYVLEGALEHRDSMGNGEVLRPGEFQRMSAGTGITHSEFNPSASEPVHFYQIWLLPERNGIEPGYEQKRFPEHGRSNRLRLVASRDAAEGSLTIHQDARIYLASMEPSAEITHALQAGRHAWVQVLRGVVSLGQHELQAGDGAALSDELELTLKARDAAEVMLFDLA
jgi:quercetin 2,3-dioxygenase